MIAQLLTSAKLILGTFTASTATAFALCKLYNVPFFNPNKNRYLFYIQTQEVIQNVSTSLFQTIVVSSFLLEFIENKPHSVIQTAENILKFSILSEFIYYVYHRIIHSNIFYKSIHSLHHENVQVYPFDTFHGTNLDTLFLILALSVPNLFLRLNYVEVTTTLYLYVTATYLDHSNILLIHHAKHHKLIFCNYCILNPIFDILLGTYRY
jgi:sterol desaturase/sphingolipid hydroxylase (fatty acid hydroxylase superfamily)